MTSPCINNDFNDIQRTHHKYFPLHHCNLLLTVCMIESCLKNIVSYLALLWLCITSTKQWGCSDIILQDVVRVVLYDRWLFDTSGEHFWKHSLGYRSALVRFELCGSLPRSNLRHRSGKKPIVSPHFLFLGCSECKRKLSILKEGWTEDTCVMGLCWNVSSE